MTIGDSGKLHKLVNGASAVIFVGTSFIQTLNVAAAKYATFNAPLVAIGQPSKLLTVISRITGPSVASQIMGFPPGQLAPAGAAPQGIAPLGWLNPTTYTGVGILAFTVITDAIAGKYINKYGWTYLKPLLLAVGGGNLTGGIIGGLLDPPGGGPSTGGIGGTTGRAGGGFAFANATAGRSVMGFTGAY